MPVINYDLLDYIYIEFDSKRNYYVAINHPKINSIKVPIMDCSIEEFIDHYKYDDNAVIVNENKVPLCVFAFRSNAAKVCEIMQRVSFRCFVDKKDFKKS